MNHQSSGNVSLHDPTSHRRNTPCRSSFVGRVAVAEAAAVVGAVHRGRSVASVPTPSALEGSQLRVADSVSPSPAAVTVFLHQVVPPASVPEAPRSLVPAGASPPTGSGSISVRRPPPPLWSQCCCRHHRQHTPDTSDPDLAY